MRKFETGATRDDNDSKMDYSGFIAPEFLRSFAAYMHKHRKQADGNLRASDNWKKGMPIECYKESLIRHVIDWWQAFDNKDWESADDLANAITFNLQGYVYERSKIKAREDAEKRKAASERDITPRAHIFEGPLSRMGS